MPATGSGRSITPFQAKQDGKRSPRKSLRCGSESDSLTSALSASWRSAARMRQRLLKGSIPAGLPNCSRG